MSHRSVLLLASAISPGQVVIAARERAELNLVAMQLARLVRYKERAEGKGGTDALA